MAERLKRAAAWLGLVTDDRYADYDEADDELTEGISREELLASSDKPATVTPLESRRPGGSTVASHHRQPPSLTDGRCDPDHYSSSAHL